MMIIRQLRILRCRALNICVTFRSLWATSRDGSPKGPFPSIRFLVLRGYFWASALPIDFCTRGVRYRCVFDGLQAGMNAAIAGMAAPVEILLRAGVEPNTTVVENPYSCQMRSDGKTRKITAIKLLDSKGSTYRRTRRVSLLGPARTRTLFALRQKQKKEHRSDIRKTQSRQPESLGPEWIWPRPNKGV
jgi:hypothetical protein